MENSLGKIICDLRREARLSQRTLAERSGISLRTLREIEHGRVRRPHPSSLQRVALVLDDPRLSDALAGQVGDRTALGDGHHSLNLQVFGHLTLKLGPVELGLGTPMQRTLLGLLAIHANQVVACEEIVEVLWGDDPPNTFTQLIHTYVSRLRSLFNRQSDTLTQRPQVGYHRGGYELRIVSERLDLGVFNDLIQEAADARRCGDLTAEYDILAQALALPAGPLLEGAASGLREHRFAEEHRRGHLVAVLRFAQMESSLGHYEEAIAILRPLVPQYRLHEGLHAALMLAFAASGQQVAALDLYNGLVSRLRTQFGLEPSPDLRAAHMSVLRQNAARESLSLGAPAPAAIPHSLGDFVGREELYPVLRYLVGARSATPFGAAPIASLHGGPGVGKSALAIRVASRCLSRYPDGVLYVDGPVDAHPVLGCFLRELGVQAQDVPTSLAERIRLFRALLTHRRVLVVVDNMEREDVVRALVPTGFHTGMLITGRERFYAEGVRHFLIPAFTADQAYELLCRMIGISRVAAEPTAAQMIIERHDADPKSLRSVGLRLAAQTDLPLAELCGDPTASTTVRV
ncbi:BTAD domain-containing putative transcriptional regulator [Frankia sp. AgB32]|uniref:BTAD domain-containing putative transcriptional regulator n=1 Tax=Frankia sp. AgB32 TaxID=631119 RepID=UPI00200FBF28|nr:BTAD domain-containing putative transcriptional regulator [Frankia sp. AgB32]MCK9896365.1 winged helix-turn-helix domain-containing protein [Frankia sp. AgB32]